MRQSEKFRKLSLLQALRGGELQQVIEQAKSILDTVKTPSQVPSEQAMESVKSPLAEKVQQVEGLGQSLIENLSQFTDKAKETTVNFQETLTSTTSQVLSGMGERAQQVTEQTKAVLETFKTTTQVTTEYATEAVKSSVTESINQVQQFRQLLVADVQEGTGYLITHWFKSDPLFMSLVSHPFLSLGLGFLMIFLLWGFIRALLVLIEQLWINLLKLPLWLIGSLGGIGLRKKTKFQQGGLASDRTFNNKNEKIDYILTRLAELQQEQQSLLRTLAALNQTNR